MKNEVNRAFMAKKKNYINPEVQVAQIALESMVLAGSSPSSGGDKLNDIETDDQW